MRNVELIKKYSRMPMQTPDMTSSSVNGFTASGEIGYFNSNYYRLTYQGENGTLYFPSGRTALLNKVYVGTNWNGVPWYFSRYDSIYLYYNEVLMNTLHFDPISYVGNFYNFSETKCNKIYHAYGTGSSWSGNGGQAYIGKKFFGSWL